MPDTEMENDNQSLISHPLAAFFVPHYFLPFARCIPLCYLHKEMLQIKHPCNTYLRKTKFCLIIPCQANFVVVKKLSPYYGILNEFEGLPVSTLTFRTVLF